MPWLSTKVCETFQTIDGRHQEWQNFTTPGVSAVQVHYSNVYHHCVIFPVSKPGDPIQGRHAHLWFQHKSLLSCFQCIQSTWLNNWILCLILCFADFSFLRNVYDAKLSDWCDCKAHGFCTLLTLVWTFFVFVVIVVCCRRQASSDINDNHVS